MSGILLASEARDGVISFSGNQNAAGDIPNVELSVLRPKSIKPALACLGDA